MQNSFSEALVGDNYLSYLKGIINLQSGHPTLVLLNQYLSCNHDSRIYLGLIEIKLLKMIGEHYQIFSLKNLDEFLLPIDFVFFIDNIQISLGQGPFSNLEEFVRKFPLSTQDLWGKFPLESKARYQEDFNLNFDIACTTVAEKLFCGQYSLTDALASLENWQDLGYIYQAFSRILFSDEEFAAKENIILKTLIHLSMAHFQNKLTTNISANELLHIISVLLSPKKILDHRRFNGQLQADFVRHGGSLARAQIAQISPCVGGSWHLLLETVDGIVEAKKIIIIGENSYLNLPWKINLPVRVFRSVVCRIQQNEKHIIKNTTFLYSGVNRIGTNRPLWRVVFNQECVDIHLVVPSYSAAKVDFYRAEFDEFLAGEFKRKFFEIKMSNFELFWGDDHWPQIAGGRKLPFFKKEHQRAQVELLSLADLKSPHGITYLGCLNNTGPQMISTMDQLGVLPAEGELG